MESLYYVTYEFLCRIQERFSLPRLNLPKLCNEVPLSKKNVFLLFIKWWLLRYLWPFKGLGTQGKWKAVQMTGGRKKADVHYYKGLK